MKFFSRVINSPKKYSIDEHYLLTKAIFKKHSQKILADIEKSRYSNCNRALFHCQIKVEQLLLAIEGLGGSKNYYASQAIMRILYEHFLVGYYIGNKTRIDENDKCGEEYYAYYPVSEFFKRENYDLRIESIEQNIKPEITFEKLKKRLPEFDDVEEKDLHEIHHIANQFDVRTLLDYILNKLPKDDLFREPHKMFIQFLKEYNKLSSFIHGGPLAELEAFNNKPKIDKDKRLISCILWAKFASRLLKEHLMTLLIDDFKEYGAIMSPIISYMHTNTLYEARK